MRGRYTLDDIDELREYYGLKMTASVEPKYNAVLREKE